MKFVFGTTLVTTKIDDARIVAFDHGVQKRTVSFDGASFDPSGVISGGAQPKGPSTLELVAQIQKDRTELASREQAYADISKELGGIQAVALNLQLSPLSQFTLRTLALGAAAEESKAKLQECKETQQKASARVKELEEKVKDSKNIRDRELKAAEQQIAKAKKKADESSKKATAKKQEEVKLAGDEVKSQKEKLKAASREISEKYAERAAVEKQAGQLKLKIQQWEHDVSKIDREASDAVKKV
ncbi:hypothetical protein V5799_019565 [Amblyomma americanum]|uniref:Uncharacterized protein n=1 Tax=Amblyomma americanum TaxID=6943 RepID=A0AAQ4EWV4_AMBAM